MFETVAYEGHAGGGGRRLFYETLPLSVVLHATVITVCLIPARTGFPDHPPKSTLSYLLIDGGAGLPPPPRSLETSLPKAASDAPKPPPAPSPEPTPEQEAPTVIPDSVAPVAPPPPPVPTEPHEVAPPEVKVVDSSPPETGLVGGVLMDDGRVHFGRGGILPLGALEMDPPEYPDAARRAKSQGNVVIRYVVGKNGMVTDVYAVERAAWPVLDQAAITAIRRWKFQPLIYRGEAREVVHEVLICFRLRKEVAKK